jgi:hypothetical protein
MREWEAGPEFAALTAPIVAAQKAVEDYRTAIGNAPLIRPGSNLFKFPTDEGSRLEQLQGTVKHQQRVRADAQSSKAQSIHQLFQEKLKNAIETYAKSQKITVVLHHTNHFYYIEDVADITNDVVAILNGTAKRGV